MEQVFSYIISLGASVMMPIIFTFFCFVSGVNFTLLYISVSKRKLSTLLKSAEC